jgi:hypothetical protein
MLDRVIRASAEGDSFISYLPVPANIRAIRELGIAEFARRQDARVSFLKGLINVHDDGRSKGFYCLAVQLLPREELQTALHRLNTELSQTSEIKSRAAKVRATFTELASSKGLTLKLRHPKKEADHNL